MAIRRRLSLCRRESDRRRRRRRLERRRVVARSSRRLRERETEREGISRVGCTYHKVSCWRPCRDVRKPSTGKRLIRTTPFSDGRAQQSAVHAVQKRGGQRRRRLYSAIV